VKTPRTSGSVVLAWVTLFVSGLSAQSPSIAPVPLPSNPQPVYPAGAVNSAAIGRVEVEFVVVDGRLESRLNGALVSSIVDHRFTGMIGFEVRAGELEVRGVVITRQDTFFGGDFDVLGKKDPAVAGPALIQEVKPRYSALAMKNKVQGKVMVFAVVDEKGYVLNPRVQKSLDVDLDQSAVAAARQWQFRPALKDGLPVALPITIEMSFALK
jgi:TonB family protein